MRVGFVTCYAWDHAVGRMLLGILRAIARHNDHAAAEAAALSMADNDSGKPQQRLRTIELTLVSAADVKGNKVDVNGGGDLVRSELLRLVDRYLEVSFGDRDVRRVAGEVKDLGLDVAVFTDLGMDQTCCWPSVVAPVQMVTHGHPVTTGLVGSVDYFVTASSLLWRASHAQRDTPDAAQDTPRLPHRRAALLPPAAAAGKKKKRGSRGKEARPRW